MQVKQLLTEDRAVSPVIGVILMVAITVILAAVIGTFVLGLGQNVQSTPQASFNFDFGTSNASSANPVVNVTHEGGDRLEFGNNAQFVNITSTESSTTVTWLQEGGGGADDDVTSIGAGTTFSNYEYGGSGATVRVTWTGENGQSTATLGSAEAP